MTKEKQKKIKGGDIVEIFWYDAQSLELNPTMNYPEELKGLKGIVCSIAGYLVAENQDGYVMAKEKWATGQYKYIHFIPRKSVIKINRLKTKD